MTDSPDSQAKETVDPSPGTEGKRTPRPYNTERIIVGSVFIAGVIAWIANGAWVVHQDTFREAKIPSRFAHCSEGIRTLFRGYTDAFTSAETDTDNGQVKTVRTVLDAKENLLVMPALDEELTALRVVCAHEGAPAEEAYDAFTVWRYQAEDLARMSDHVLVPDARRALGYLSPGAQTPAVSGTHP